MIRSANPAGRVRQLFVLWLGWAILILGFQAIAPGRFEPVRPDRSTPWTASETLADSHIGQPYLLERFLNRQVAWDSEFFLSIALGGYDDPQMRSLGPDSDLGSAKLAPHAQHPDWPTLNNAFLPAYPFAIRGLMPLSPLRLTPIQVATLAGVIVALAGTLAGLLALADLAQVDASDANEGLRAASHLLVWPASFFLAQVYSEGLFIGLSFGALALARRRRWLLAALLAAISVWTRSTGALLALPLAWMWWRQSGASAPERLRGLVAVAAPAIGYFAWRAIWGARFDFIDGHFFGRGLLWLRFSWDSWRDAYDRVAGGEPQALAYYSVELWGVIAGGVAGLWLLRRDPALALYTLAVLGVALTSGTAQGMHRYIMSAPGVFLVSARLGRAPAFDRLWMVGNSLALAVFALAFSWDFWAG